MANSEDTTCEKYQKVVINLLILLVKLIGASKESIDEALKPLNEK